MDIVAWLQDSTPRICARTSAPIRMPFPPSSHATTALLPNSWATGCWPILAIRGRMRTTPSGVRTPKSATSLPLLSVSSRLQLHRPRGGVVEQPAGLDVAPGDVGVLARVRPTPITSGGASPVPNHRSLENSGSGLLYIGNVS
jgi:hypothetical protein